MGGLSNILIPLPIFYWLYTHYRVFTLPDTVWGWVLGFLLHDFLYWFGHLLGHKVGFWWAFHQVHHSSEEFNFTVAARGNFLDDTPLAQPAYMLMPLLGMSLTQIVGVVILTNIFGIFNHTRLIKRMGWLEYILCTPSNHHVHHGTQPKYLDKNYGQVLIIWDMIFGTFQREEEEPRYGLVKNIDTLHPVAIQVSGFRWLWQQLQSAPRWQDKLWYLLMPSGWRHDGNHETSAVLKSREYPHHNEDISTHNTNAYPVK